MKRMKKIAMLSLTALLANGLAYGSAEEYANESNGISSSSPGGADFILGLLDADYPSLLAALDAETDQQEYEKRLAATLDMAINDQAGNVVRELLERGAGMDSDMLRHAVRIGNAELVSIFINEYNYRLRVFLPNGTDAPAVAVQASQGAGRFFSLLSLPTEILDQNVFDRCELSNLMALRNVCSALRPTADQCLDREYQRRNTHFKNFLYYNDLNQDLRVLRKFMGQKKALEIAELLKARHTSGL